MRYAKEFNKKWANNLSKFKIGAKKIYLSSILDFLNVSVIPSNASITLAFLQSKKMLNKS